MELADFPEVRVRFVGLRWVVIRLKKGVASVTFPLKPPRLVTVAVAVELEPARMVWKDGDTVRPNDGPVTTTKIVAERNMMPD